MTMNTNDRQEAARWAHDLLKRSNWVILDTETTGLSESAQICQIAVVDSQGSTLLDTLVKPTVSIGPEATAIHGITDDIASNAQTFDVVLLQLLKSVGNNDVVIYNADFDLRLIQQSLSPHGIQLAFPTLERRQSRLFTNGGAIHCAMLQYSEFVGDWNSYYGNYRWQKLPGGDHSALGDVLAVYRVLQEMASAYQQPVLVTQDDDIPF